MKSDADSLKIELEIEPVVSPHDAKIWYSVCRTDDYTVGDFHESLDAAIRWGQSQLERWRDTFLDADPLEKK